MTFLYKLLTPAKILIVFLFATSAMAQSKIKMTVDHVTKMNCAEALEQLTNRIELSHQLADSYLQANETIEDIYATWGSKLLALKDLKDLPNIAKFFRNSASSVREARLQSAIALEELKSETNLLMVRIGKCSSP